MTGDPSWYGGIELDHVDRTCFLKVLPKRNRPPRLIGEVGAP